MSNSEFDYKEAFSRNIGWTTHEEQAALRNKTVAIAGMGGVGGAHVITLTRLGIGGFKVSDMDQFEVANFNRQAGANLNTIKKPKVDAVTQQALDINPELKIEKFPNGIDESNLDEFLKGVDIYVDALDFFTLPIRRKIFARCRELGIPAVTAAPLGMGTAYLIFLPDSVRFDDYFALDGLSEVDQYVNFLLGISPALLQRSYLVDPSTVNFNNHKGPSTIMACQLCAGVIGTEVLKILLKRGKVYPAPYYHQFDAYHGRYKRGYLYFGNKNPIQWIKKFIFKKIVLQK